MRSIYLIIFLSPGNPISKIDLISKTENFENLFDFDECLKNIKIGKPAFKKDGTIFGIFNFDKIIVNVKNLKFRIVLFLETILC